MKAANKRRPQIKNPALFFCHPHRQFMSYLLALDQGTTSSRAIVFDSSGRIVHTAQQEFPQIYPRTGWVEHDPEAIWKSQLAVAAQAMIECGVPARSVKAAGITNQRETTILWDKRTGEPVYNAIVWQDRRTAGYCDELRRAGTESEVQARTGLLLDPYFSGTKLRWMLENVQGVRRRAEAGDLAFGTVDTWLIWKLTGGVVHATDPSNASRTLLFNIHTGTWDEEMLRLLGIPAQVLPEVRPSSGSFGDIANAAFPGQYAHHRRGR